MRLTCVKHCSGGQEVLLLFTRDETSLHTGPTIWLTRSSYICRKDEKVCSVVFFIFFNCAAFNSRMLSGVITFSHNIQITLLHFRCSFAIISTMTPEVYLYFHSKIFDKYVTIANVVWWSLAFPLNFPTSLYPIFWILFRFPLSSN